MRLKPWQPYQLLVKRLSIALLLYSISRVVFALCNPGTAIGGGITPFIYGIRYDIAAIVILQSLFIVLHLYPTQLFFNKIYQNFLAFFFHFINGLALLFNYIDCAWFPFTQKRTTADFFTLLKTGNDAGNNIGQYVVDYWYIVVTWLLSIFLGIFLYKKTRINYHNQQLPKIIIRLCVLIVSVAIFVIAARGGLQYKPLSVQEAASMTKQQCIPLVLNTPYTLIKNYSADPLPSELYMSTIQADQLFNPHQQMNPMDSMDKKNVVIIILESFSKQYIGAFNNGIGYTPFLDSLMKESLVYTRAYANGKRSIEGIPAVTSSMPSLMDEPFITSAWNTNYISSIASTLKPFGYSSAFFHGGNNGTMGFDSFCNLIGYDQYNGRKEYDGAKSDYDGNWGIFDEPFYQFMIRKMNKMQQPFLSTVFSLSSHHPYTIPAPYKNKFPKGTQEIHESIGYADYALGTFFKEASKQPWFKNTLFVITADHTGPASGSYYTTRQGIYEIPILFYESNPVLKGKSNIVAQQIDIFPTVLDYLHYNGKFSSFGQSLLANIPMRGAVNYMNNSWQLITANYSLLFDGNKTTGLYNLKNDSLLQNNLNVSLADTVRYYEPFLKAILQQYRQGLIHNTIVKK